MWQAPHKEEQRSLQPGSARGYPSQENNLQPGSARGHPSQENYQGPKRPADARRFRLDGALIPSAETSRVAQRSNLHSSCSAKPSRDHHLHQYPVQQSRRCPARHGPRASREDGSGDRSTAQGRAWHRRRGEAGYECGPGGNASLYKKFLCVTEENGIGNYRGMLANWAPSGLKPVPKKSISRSDTSGLRCSGR